jgi:hypothetical protein
MDDDRHSWDIVPGVLVAVEEVGSLSAIQVWVLIEPYCYGTVVGTGHGEVLLRETECHGTIKNTFAELAKRYAPWAADRIASFKWEMSP